jgi:tRNA threonylcarbamoyladenosine biosynthesis protein TsaE
MNSITIHQLSELPAIAKQLIASFADKKVIAFYGAMGAGKTTLIKTICKELGVTDSISSPTFSIVNEYRAANGKKIYHFDFYRLASMDEAYDMGYEDYFYSDAYCFIEWPEKIAELLPVEYKKITITATGMQRMIEYE